MRRLAAALILALTACGAGGGPALAVVAAEALVPHKAVYALSLDSVESSSQVIDATGRFEFEWKNVCDGWAISQKFRIALLYEGGMPVTYAWSYSAWESRDGTRFRFFRRHFDENGEVMRASGEAELRPDGAGSAVIRDPDSRELDLPQGTLFPTGHTLHVLNEAEVDSAPLWTMVFDGSGGDGLFGVSTTLSQALGPEAPTRLESTLIDDVPSWRVQLAFFGAGAESVEPEQEQGLRLFANGVVDEMTLDYGDFVLASDLTELAELPPPDC